MPTDILQLSTGSIPPLIASMLLLVVIVVAAIGSRGSRAGMYFIYWAFTLAIWLFFAALIYSAESPERGMDFVFSAHMGINFIPVTALSFVLIITNHRLGNRPWLMLMWLPSVLFTLLMLTTDQVFTGMLRYSWGYYPEYGIYGIAFIVWFCFLFLTAFWLMFLGWRKAAPGSRTRKRNGGLVAMFGFAMLGVLDFLPSFGIDYFPLGWLPVSVYSLSALYLMYKYPLTDIGSAYTSEQIIKSVDSGLLIIDEDHIVQLANPAIRELLNVEPKHITGQLITSALPSDRLGQRLDQILLENDSFIVDFPLKNTRTGQSQVVKVMINEVHNETGIRVGSLCILEDVTEVRRSQQELVDLVAQRTHELEIMRDRAMEANHAKSAFLANMSHELRTPLTAIIGYSELLAEDFHNMEKDEVLSDLDKVVTSSRHLLSLINTVLDLSKIEAGKMEIHIESTDMEMLILEISATISPLMTQAGIKFEIEQQGWQEEFNTDPVKLKQVLINLLSNASKFTNNGEVLFSAKRSNDGAMFVVRDNGLGMSKEELSTLFDEYQQASTTAGKFGGTGLGLSIVKGFIELMNGTIEVRSQPGKGTEFTIFLPG